MAVDDRGSAPNPPLEAVHDGGSAPKPPLEAVHDGGSAPKPPLKAARAAGLRPWAFVVAGAVALAVTALPAAARADDTTAAARAAAARTMDRPHTLAEVNTGFLLLPGALVCPKALDQTCQRGEFSFAVGLRNVWRWRAFGFGAGIQWATTLRTDAANGDASLQRQHSRRYFLVEGLVRYYLLKSKSWDFWAGGTFGGIVVNDSWSVNADRNPYSDTQLVGPRAATLGTEGLTVGVCAGAEWTFLTNWSLGPSLRYSNWFLPNTRKMSPTLDVASLAGRLDMIDVGIRITYRIAL